MCRNKITPSPQSRQTKSSAEILYAGPLMNNPSIQPLSCLVQEVARLERKCVRDQALFQVQESCSPCSGISLVATL